MSNLECLPHLRLSNTEDLGDVGKEEEQINQEGMSPPKSKQRCFTNSGAARGVRCCVEFKNDKQRKLPGFGNMGLREMMFHHSRRKVMLQWAGYKTAKSCIDDS